MEFSFAIAIAILTVFSELTGNSDVPHRIFRVASDPKPHTKDAFRFATYPEMNIGTRGPTLTPQRCGSEASPQPELHLQQLVVHGLGR